MNKGSKIVMELLREALKTSFDLFKIMIPLSILTRICNEAGVTDYLGFALSPVMEMVGLPGSMGLVWAAGIITNLYGAMIVFATLAPETHLTVAQVTVLTTMMLVAHALPVELRIAQKAGPRFRFMVFLRLFGALLVGWLLFRIYLLSGYLQTPNRALWNPPQRDPGWLAWARGEVYNLFLIFLIIVALLVLMKFLYRLNIINLLTRLLEPVLILFGMSKAAAPITIIGMTMGISYGGGLILQEAKSGRLMKRDLFFSLSLMGLSHGLIEDTMLMMLIGGHLSGILWGRLFFSLLILFLMVKLLSRVKEDTFDRFLFRV